MLGVKENKTRKEEDGKRKRGGRDKQYKEMCGGYDGGREETRKERVRRMVGRRGQVLLRFFYGEGTTE